MIRRNAIALAGAAALLTGCALRSAEEPPSLDAKPGFPVYDGSMTVDPATQRLDARWQIAFVPADASADVVLLLNRGLRVSALGGAGVAGYSQTDSAGWNVVRVRLAAAPAAAAVRRIDIAYAGVPAFSEDGINRIAPDWIELGLDSFWHPVFAGFDQLLTGVLRVRLPGAWTGVASGEFAREGNTLLFRNPTPLIDFAFAAAPVLDRTGSGRTTIYHVDADSVTIARILRTAALCGEYLDARYAEREALPEVKILLAPRDGPGYARTNYIVVTRAKEMEDVAMSRFVCHELAHFWSTGAVSSGPENWLNEAFAEFVALRFVRATHGEDAYQQILAQLRTVSAGQPAVWTPAATTRPSGIVSYRKAPYLLHRLEERIGSARMEQILVRRMSERITNTRQLLGIVEDVAGAAHARWLEQELGR